MTGKFTDLGKVVTTTQIAKDMKNNEEFKEEVNECLDKYTERNWGDLCEEDIKANNYAADNEEKIVAAYNTCEGKIWIITEWDRSVTTVLYPSED